VVVFVRGNDTAAELLKTTSCSVTRMGVMEGSALSQTPSVIDVPTLTKGGTAGRTGFSTTTVAASRGVLNLVMPQCSTRTLGPRMGHLPQLSGLLTVAPGSWANASAGTVLWSAAVLAPALPGRSSIILKVDDLDLRPIHPRQESAS
jgi:hypothetical protein